MSFDGYFASQLDDPKFAAAYWRARCDFIGTKTLALEARVAALEEAIVSARRAMNESGAEHWAYELLLEAVPKTKEEL